MFFDGHRGGVVEKMKTAYICRAGDAIPHTTSPPVGLRLNACTSLACKDMSTPAKIGFDEGAPAAPRRPGTQRRHTHAHGAHCQPPPRGRATAEPRAPFRARLRAAGLRDPRSGLVHDCRHSVFVLCCAIFGGGWRRSLRGTVVEGGDRRAPRPRGRVYFSIKSRSSCDEISCVFIYKH